MAIYDRWYRTEKQPDGTRRKVRSDDYGCKERWQVRWRDEQGRQRKQSHERKVDAEQAEAKIRAQLDDGTYVDPSAGQVSFRAYAEEWRGTRMHDPATAERIESALRNHAYAREGAPGKTPRGGAAIGDYPLRILAKRTSILQMWIAGLPLNANSARTVIGYASQVFTAAAEDGLIARNPLSARSIQLPSPVKTDAVPWSLPEVEAVSAALPGWLAAVPYLGAACGQRQGELFATAKSDLDFLRRTAHVEVQIKVVGGAQVFAPLKNKKTRDVPVAARVLPVLAEHMRAFPPVAVTLPWHDPRDPRKHGQPVTRELVFTRPGGLQLAREAFNGPWRAAWAKAGIPDRGRLNGCHVLRHTAASQWLSAGLNPAKVAAYLGDTLEVVLKTYAHFLPDDDDRARAIMDLFFDPGSSALDVPRAAR
jgi:integrase